MKRFHVHLSVPDLSASVRFYSGLFGAAPAVMKDDYAKWMLDDPLVNFAISTRANGTVGLNHLGLQVDSEDDLASVRQLFDAADSSTSAAEPGAMCCYAHSNKHWVQDPQGIAWEAFHSLDAIPVWGDAGPVPATARETACCLPRTSAPAAAPTAMAKPVSVSVATASCCAPAAAGGAKGCC